MSQNIVILHHSKILFIFNTVLFWDTQYIGHSPIQMRMIPDYCIWCQKKKIWCTGNILKYLRVNMSLVAIWYESKFMFILSRLMIRQACLSWKLKLKVTKLCFFTTGPHYFLYWYNIKFPSLPCNVFISYVLLIKIKVNICIEGVSDILVQSIKCNYTDLNFSPLYLVKTVLVFGLKQFYCYWSPQCLSMSMNTF